MAHQDQDSQFLNATAKSDRTHYLIQKAAFTLLALTTGGMVYGAFDGLLQTHAPPWLYRPALIGVIFLAYLIIDHRLDGDFMDHWRTKDQVDKMKLTTTEKLAMRRYRRRRTVMLYARYLLTITSSLWGAGMIAEWATPDADIQSYTHQMTDHETRNANREAVALATLQEAQGKEAERVEAATDKGDAIIRQAINSGNVHQRDMYRRNPGFFYPPPRGQYYTSNKNYGARIAAAKAEKAALIAEAKGYVAEARGALAQVQGKVATDSTATMINALALKDVEITAASEGRKRGFFVLIDIAAAVFGLLMVRIRYLRLKAIGWSAPTGRRNLSSMLAAWRDKQWEEILTWLENLLNLDLDGNGTIGQVGPATAGNTGGNGTYFRNHTTNSAPPPPPPADENSRFFFRRGTPAPPSRPAPPPADRVPVPAVESVATRSYNVATSTGNATTATPPPAAQTRLASWKNLQKTVKSYEGRTDSETVRQRLATLASQQEVEVSALLNMGWCIKKLPGRTGRYYLVPI